MRQIRDTFEVARKARAQGAFIRSGNVHKDSISTEIYCPECYAVGFEGESHSPRPRLVKATQCCNCPNTGVMIYGSQSPAPHRHNSACSVSRGCPKRNHGACEACGKRRVLYRGTMCGPCFNASVAAVVDPEYVGLPDAGHVLTSGPHGGGSDMRNLIDAWYAVYSDAPEGTMAEPGVTLEALAEALPHGSGFDGNWRIATRRDGGLTLYTGYHSMNSDGYYTGWWPVRMVLQRGNAGVLIVGSVRVNARGTNDAGDYIGDTVADALRSLRPTSPMGATTDAAGNDGPTLN